MELCTVAICEISIGNVREIARHDEVLREMNGIVEDGRQR